MTAPLPGHVLDAAGFEDAVRTCGPRLLRTARLLVGDEGTAQDLLQTSFSVVWRKRADVRGPEAVEAYARTVMARLAAARWRRKWSGEKPTEVLPERAGAADRDVAASVAVGVALAQLSRRERSVLVLRYFEDLSIEATAEALGVPQTTVTAAARHGLERLRSMDWEGFTS